MKQRKIVKQKRYVKQRKIVKQNIQKNMVREGINPSPYFLPLSVIARNFEKISWQSRVVCCCLSFIFAVAFCLCR
jgi:hypothetical protein